MFFLSLPRTVDKFNNMWKGNFKIRMIMINNFWVIYIRLMSQLSETKILLCTQWLILHMLSLNSWYRWISQLICTNSLAQQQSDRAVTLAKCFSPDRITNSKISWRLIGWNHFINNYHLLMSNGTSDMWWNEFTWFSCYSK